MSYKQAVDCIEDFFSKQHVQTVFDFHDLNMDFTVNMASVPFKNGFEQLYMQVFMQGCLLKM